MQVLQQQVVFSERLKVQRQLLIALALHRTSAVRLIYVPARYDLLWPKFKRNFFPSPQFFAISAGPPPPQAIAPDVVGLAIGVATTAILAAQMTVGSPLGAAYSSLYPIPNTVISQSVPAGTPIQSGTPLYLVVSLGPRPKILKLPAPTKVAIDMRSLSYGLAGPIAPYPVYQFSGYRVKWERDGHNPFAGE